MPGMQSAQSQVQANNALYTGNGEKILTISAQTKSDCGVYINMFLSGFRCGYGQSQLTRI